MKKAVKIIAAVAIICFLAYFVYVAFVGGYSSDWKTCKQYMWVFKDSVKNNIDPLGYSLCSSFVKKNDIHNVFHYYKNDNMYPILVWEFKDLGDVDLNKIVINQNIDLSTVKFSFGETLDSESSMPVMVRFNIVFHGGLNINLDDFSKIDGTFKGRNYKGFYGTINKMSFSNTKGESQVLFDYSSKPYKPSFSPTVFLLYKGHQSFYVIIINSKQPFKDANIINILNLK